MNNGRLGIRNRNCNFGFVVAISFAIFGSPVFCGVASAQDGPGIDKFRPPQQIDGSKTSSLGSQGSGRLTQGVGDVDSKGQKIFDALFQELDNMIPGDFLPGSEVKKEIENAVTAFQIKDVNRVRKIFTDLHAKNSSFPPPDLLLAALSYAIQDARSGLALLERCAIENPEYPGVYSSLARLAINQNRVSDGLALLEKCERVLDASTVDQESKTFYRHQVRDGLIDVLMRQRKYTDAREYLKAQREELPDNPKVLMISAELEFHEKNIEKSMDYLKEIKSKFAKTKTPESIMANWYMRSGDMKEAEAWFSKSAGLYPEDDKVQLEYASWAIERENFPAASSAISKAEKVSSETLFSRNLKGKIAFCNQSYATAEAHFQKIAEQQPKNFDAVNMFALSLIESNSEAKRKMARDIAMQNFRAIPDNKIAIAALGYVELKLGQVEQAKTILSKATSPPGAVPEIDFYVASLLTELGEKDQAIKFLDAALKRDGIFMYRSAATKLREKLSSGEAGNLPSPKLK